MRPVEIITQSMWSAARYRSPTLLYTSSAHKPDWKASITVTSVHLALGNRIPPEVQLPVESPIRHIWSDKKRKCFVTDDVNNGANDSWPETKNETKFCSTARENNYENNSMRDDHTLYVDNQT